MNHIRVKSRGRKFRKLQQGLSSFLTRPVFIFRISYCVEIPDTQYEIRNIIVGVGGIKSWKRPK